MRRFDGSGDYNRSWDEYKQGFGDASGEYWLGNEYLHYLTSNRAYKLRFNLEDWDGNTTYAEYSSFRVTSEADNYRLLLGDYTGNASADQAFDISGGFLYHNNSQFSTNDRDNDLDASSSCAQAYNQGGFWYKSCFTINPTSIGCTSEAAASCSVFEHIRWNSSQIRTFIKKITMMLRPAA